VLQAMPGQARRGRPTHTTFWPIVRGSQGEVTTSPTSHRASSPPPHTQACGRGRWDLPHLPLPYLLPRHRHQRRGTEPGGGGVRQQTLLAPNRQYSGRQMLRITCAGRGGGGQTLGRVYS